MVKTRHFPPWNLHIRQGIRPGPVIPTLITIWYMYLEKEAGISDDVCMLETRKSKTR
jgi:hypothetical protein